MERIWRALPGVKSIVQNVNTRSTNVIFGDETRVLWGSDVIYDELGRHPVRDLGAFVLSGESGADGGAVPEGGGICRADGAETVIDAYCGIGTISLFLARRAGKVYGVEIGAGGGRGCAAQRGAERDRECRVRGRARGRGDPRWREAGRRARM